MKTNSDQYKNQLLEIIINFIFFENILSSIEEKRFHKNDNLFLIDYNIIHEIKSCIDYNYFKNYILKKYNYITYSNLNQYIDSIISEEKNELEVTKINEISEPSPRKIQYKDMIYFPNVYIISSTILGTMKKFVEFNQHDKFILKKSIIIFKKEEIIIFQDSCLNVGYFNDDFEFITKYLFSFKYYHKDKEIKEITKIPIDEYITTRNCVTNNYEIQILKNNYSEVGNLLINKNKDKNDFKINIEIQEDEKEKNDKLSSELQNKEKTNQNQKESNEQLNSEIKNKETKNEVIKIQLEENSDENKDEEIKKLKSELQKEKEENIKLYMEIDNIKKNNQQLENKAQDEYNKIKKIYELKIEEKEKEIKIIKNKLNEQILKKENLKKEIEKLSNVV